MSWINLKEPQKLGQRRSNHSRHHCDHSCRGTYSETLSPGCLLQKGTDESHRSHDQHQHQTHMELLRHLHCVAQSQTPHCQHHALPTCVASQTHKHREEKGEAHVSLHQPAEGVQDQRRQTLHQEHGHKPSTSWPKKMQRFFHSKLLLLLLLLFGMVLVLFLRFSLTGCLTRLSCLSGLTGLFAIFEVFASFLGGKGESIRQEAKGGHRQEDTHSETR
mmetsp:Transcript_43329/g.68698  ORF Transcript_43329/g.68698 Transcript_43329/m.68698 type:complete len:218 (+) Transcript_43329:209-862(+)